jgi:hypothetical protein
MTPAVVPELTESNRQEGTDRALLDGLPQEPVEGLR